MRYHVDLLSHKVRNLETLEKRMACLRPYHWSQVRKSRVLIFLNVLGRCLLRASREAFSSTSANLSALALAVDCKVEVERKEAANSDFDQHDFAKDSDSSGMASTRCFQCISHHGYSETFKYHFAPLFGAVCGALHVSENLTLKMFLRCVLRDIFSSAARLNILGPLEGAKKQREFSFVVEKMMKSFVNQSGSIASSKNDSGKSIAAISELSSDESITGSRKRKIIEPVMKSPILEIIQARHDVLYARLFSS